MHNYMCAVSSFDCFKRGPRSGCCFAGDKSCCGSGAADAAAGQVEDSRTDWTDSTVLWIVDFLLLAHLE